MLTYQTATINRRSMLRRNRNFQTSKVSSAALGPVSTSFLLIIIVGVLALLYLTQITKTSVYGYQVNALTTERQAILSRQQELEVEAARLQSIARVRDSKVVGSLQPEQVTRFSSSSSSN